MYQIGFKNLPCELTYFVFTKVPWGRYYYRHTTDEENEAHKKLNNLSKVTQPVSGGI